MNYSIALKNLPFKPEERQVIYVENEYDEQINAIIKEKYDWLKWNFKRANLDFVYLPMFFNDEETKEKILYYAPYLSSDVMEKIELRSSYLLEFMSHLENKEKILPSLLYAPKNEDDEWSFEGQTFDFDAANNNSILQWFEDIVSEIEEALMPVGYCKTLDEIDVFPYNDSKCNSSQVEYSSTPQIDRARLEKEAREREAARIKEESGFWKKALKGLRKFGKTIDEEDGNYLAEEEGGDYYKRPPKAKETQSTLDELRDEDVRETVEELERNIKRLRLLGIPLAAIAEFVAKYETISRIKFTDDLRIFLPDYNNLEVKMGALYKAVYFLFINHPEGIILKRLEDYHHELANYYLQASGRDSLTQKMYESINTLEYPGNNYINTILSKIKLCFKATIDEHLARYYYIYGKPGEPYKIALENINIEWEDEDE
jgi:hypothetical protein